jgi:ABC-type branched-subunit amino acid transport system ATPase component
MPGGVGGSGEPRDATLSCRSVSVSFGGVAALREVTLDVIPASITAIIGPNGAGKTTLFNCITGFIRPDAGEIWFNGRRIDREHPHRIARLGVVRTFQNIRMFRDLTVYESVLVGCLFPGDHRRLPGVGEGRRRSRGEEAMAALALLGLEQDADRRCTDLPLLLQRKVELARAVATHPEVVLLDEPSAGAAIHERDALMTAIRTLRESGTTVAVIEHNVPFVMGLSDWIVVLNFGSIVASGRPPDVATNPVVQEIYLGSSSE